MIFQKQLNQYYTKQYKQAKLYCMTQNGTSHNFQNPMPNQFKRILKIFSSIGISPIIKICADCTTIKLINDLRYRRDKMSEDELNKAPYIKLNSAGKMVDTNPENLV